LSDYAHVGTYGAYTYASLGPVRAFAHTSKNFRWKYESVRQIWPLWRVWEDNIKTGLTE